jgi:hypothetical protein
MTRFIEGDCRSPSVLFPETLDDYIDQDNPVRVVDVLLSTSEVNIIYKNYTI